MLASAAVPRFARTRQWLRHHASSMTATVLDFTTMVAAVELLRASPVLATGLGAAVGGVTNFFLARQWAYRPETFDAAGAGTSPLGGQIFRYVLVSLASLGLNTWGEHLLTNVLHVQYVLGRVITAVTVSNAWNYPMQRFFVFRQSRRAP